MVINNSIFGICYILKENSYGYLIYCENNVEYFIITKEIRNNCFYINRYFKDNALTIFNELDDK